MTVVNFNYPKFKYTIPSTGEPGAGYKLFTYEEGTSTKKTTWTSLAKTAENTNPIVLDANGEADVWIDGNYKFVLALPTDTDPPASPVWTYDAIRSSETTASTSSATTTPLNGSFETDSDADGAPDNWTLAALSGGTIAIDATSQAHGVNSLKFTSTGSGAGSISTTEYYEVEAGKDIDIFFDIISANSDTHNTVEMYWYTSAKVYISATSVYDDAATNPTSWTRKYLSATAPATAKFAKIVITGVAADSTSHTTTNIDNVRIDTEATRFQISNTAGRRESLVELTANETIANAINTQIPWDAVVTDTSSIWSAGSPTRLTVPAGASRVKLSGSILFNFNATGVRTLQLLKNGAAVKGGIYANNTNPDSIYAAPLKGTSAILTVSPGDYFELDVYQNSGGNLDIIDNANTWFAMEIIE